MSDLGQNIESKFLNKEEVMSIVEQLDGCPHCPVELKQGAKARIKCTGQIVELKRVSNHGVSMVKFRTGGEYLMSNRFLEPVFIFH